MMILLELVSHSRDIQFVILKKIYMIIIYICVYSEIYQSVALNVMIR